MNAMIASTVVLVGYTPFAIAQARQPAPTSAVAPALGVVRTTTPVKGHAHLIRVVPVFERVPFMRAAADPKSPPTLVYIERTVMTEFDQIYDIGSSRVVTSDGKQLLIDEVWKRLKPGVVVAISGDSKTPSPAFLQALNPATLVIIPAAPPRIELQTPPKNVQPKVTPGDLP